jgi:ABC-type antimicrobial peptide transport system permease subunit
LFQSELLISEGNFKRLYPTIPGWRFFLIETGRNRESEVSRLLEERLADFGMDARFASERLASYHRVENAYLSTFQGLGALGLLLGTFGLGAVLVRNALERRKELALQQAVGFGPRHLAWTILTENARLLIGGIFSGCACALLAVLPALLAREAAFPWLFLLLTLLAIVGTGLIASLAAVALVLRMPMLQALRSE